jgi:hypothetical protein
MTPTTRVLVVQLYSCSGLSVSGFVQPAHATAGRQPHCDAISHTHLTAHWTAALDPSPVTMSKIFAATLLSAAFTSANAGAVSLTASNFDSETAGKGAFIKFQAPW